MDKKQKKKQNSKIFDILDCSRNIQAFFFSFGGFGLLCLQKVFSTNWINGETGRRITLKM